MRKHKKDNVTRAYKTLLQNDRDWDYEFLLRLEQKKLKRMAAYFAQSDITESNKQTAKELTLCLRLLNIVFGDERFTSDWSSETNKCLVMRTHKNPNGKGSALDSEYVGMAPDFPRYVNTRNASRFSSLRHFPKGSADSPYEQKFWQEHFKYELRQAKAWHLYNLVREYCMFGWWD